MVSQAEVMVSQASHNSKMFTKPWRVKEFPDLNTRHLQRLFVPSFEVRVSFKILDTVITRSILIFKRCSSSTFEKFIVLKNLRMNNWHIT